MRFCACDIGNVERKAFTPTEIAAISKALRPAEEVKAKKVQGTRIDLSNKDNEESANIGETFPEVKEHRARDKVAAYAGVSGPKVIGVGKLSPSSQNLRKQERIRQKEAFNAFTEENPTFVGISEGALRPLIREQDPDIRAEAIQKIRSGVSKGQPMEAENIDLYAIALKTYIMKDKVQ